MAAQLFEGTGRVLCCQGNPGTDGTIPGKASDPRIRSAFPRVVPARQKHAFVHLPDSVRATRLKRVKSVKAESGYAIRVEFEDGLAGTIDLSSELYGPVFEPLRDPRAFEQVYVDDFGVVRWPNGADLAPEALYQDLAEQMRRAS